MINNIYSRAYTEVLEIISYFPEEEYLKIPKEKIQYYKRNMDKNYKFKINPEIDLAKQNVSKEASAIIVTLFRDYFATEEQTIKIYEILALNKKKDEQEKMKKYNYDNLFKKNNKLEETQQKIEQESALAEYKENIFTRFKKFILKILH